MNPFKNLTVQENKRLLKFPAYISLLSANNNNNRDEAEIEAAIKFANIKTFSCDPLLAKYYKHADKRFEINIKQLDKDLPKERKKRDVAIKKELLKLEKIVSKLGEVYISIMQLSMKSFADHVSKVNQNVLVDFIFPITIPGLSK